MNVGDRGDSEKWNAGKIRPSSQFHKLMPGSDLEERSIIMASRAETEWRYEKLTWPEINDAVDLGKVCMLPCSAVEQHGRTCRSTST